MRPNLQETADLVTLGITCLTDLSLSLWHGRFYFTKNEVFRSGFLRKTLMENLIFVQCF